MSKYGRSCRDERQLVGRHQAKVRSGQQEYVQQEEGSQILTERHEDNVEQVELVISEVNHSPANRASRTIGLRPIAGRPQRIACLTGDRGAVETNAGHHLYHRAHHCALIFPLARRLWSNRS